MDLKSRKIEFVQEFIKLQSEEAISRFEKLLKKEKKKVNNSDFEPMAVEEFNERIDKSMKDSKADRVTEVNDLLAKIKTWN